MMVKDRNDFCSGLLFSAVGVVFALWALNYSIGSSSAMGPGYFPFALGLMLVFLGSVLTLSSLGWSKARSVHAQPAERWPQRPIVFVLGSNLVFGVLLAGIPSIGLPPFGLICAVYGLVCVASRSSGRRSAGSVLATATVLALGSYLIFVKIIGLQVAVWPWFL